MPGLAQLAGIGPLIEFGDRHVQVVGRRFCHLAEIESQIMWIIGDPIAIARDFVSYVDEDVRTPIAERVIRNVRHKYSGVTTGMISKWLTSFEGRVFAVWQAIRDSGVSYSECVDTIVSSVDSLGWEWLERIEWSVDMASNHAEYQQLLEIRSICRFDQSKCQDSFPNYDSIFRNLCREPFNLSPESVMNLTLYQITVIARDIKDSMTDEREVERLQLGSKDLGEAEKRVIWGQHYEQIAKNLATGKNIMSGLRN